MKWVLESFDYESEKAENQVKEIALLFSFLPPTLKNKKRKNRRTLTVINLPTVKF